MKGPPFFCLCLVLLFHGSSLASSYDGPLYDYSAYTKCKQQPAKPLYDGGVLKDQAADVQPVVANNGSIVYWPAFVLPNLTQGTIYCFSTRKTFSTPPIPQPPASSFSGLQSNARKYFPLKQTEHLVLLHSRPLILFGLHFNTNIRKLIETDSFEFRKEIDSICQVNEITRFMVSTGWVKINAADSALVRASLMTEDTTYNCIGTVVAKDGCWSFLKGGFVLTSSSNLSLLYFQNSDNKDINIAVASASLQPFTEQQWRWNQQYKIKSVRKRAVTIHVSDGHGDRLQGAEIMVEQLSKDFPFGSAIAKTIIGNVPYQNWFVERFNAAVFENELKWYATEPKPGQLNYTLADQMLEFVRANQIIARGHNIFWEDPKYTPEWVRNLTGSELESAVSSRIQSLMSKYKEEFIHWDVSNEMLHFDFYENRLGPNATLHFFKTAHKSDPLATLFMNEFNVVETCDDESSTVDAYISRMIELKQGGVTMDGIGLEGHFTVPNLPLMRAVIDKLATLGLPIWLTEVDISSKIDKETQAVYLEEVLREGFSHPSVNGIMLWTALHPNGCYQMCLTDSEFRNLPAGNMVDKLLREWQTRAEQGQTDEHGAYSFYGFLGEYEVSVTYGNRTANSTFSLSGGNETRHFSIQL